MGKINGIFDVAKKTNLSQLSLQEVNYPKQLKNIDFLKETCVQINKDLNGFSDDKIVLTEALLNDPFENLSQQLVYIITDLKKSRKLQAFIYKVDLDEKKYISYLLEELNENTFVSDIIKRSALKVYLRWHFSDRLKH